MIKKIIILIVVLLLLGAGAWYFFGEKKASPTPSLTATFVCENDKTIEASFFKGESVPVEPEEMPVSTDSVKLVLSDGRKFDLTQVIAASGARYANSDESFVFWNKGDDALILENGEEADFRNCKVATQVTACTQDAKLCSDGTAVGREGPNCEFPACPGE
ncbi:MAG: MliC family protein [Parcubacteria group bacterium]